MLLTFEHVTKFYGPVIGVNDISCRLGPGITGLFGSNGAGKSTLMKLASGQLRPSQGQVRLGKYRAWQTGAKHHLGYCPEINNFYEEMTGREFVDTMARLYGLSARAARERTEQVLEQVGMTSRAGRRIGGFSHGMRQRIKLAQALVNDPSVLLMDEPLGGIDPGGRRDISELLEGLAEQGKTILVSSHLLSEVEHLTDSILMIARGRIVATGSIGEIRGLIQDQPYQIEIVAEPARRLAALLVEVPEVESVAIRADALSVRTRQPDEFFALLGEMIIQHSIDVERLELLDGGADAVFGYLEQGAR